MNGEIDSNSQVTTDEFICIRKSNVRGATVRPNHDVDTQVPKENKTKSIFHLERN